MFIIVLNFNTTLVNVQLHRNEEGVLYANDFNTTLVNVQLMSQNYGSMQYLNFNTTLVNVQRTLWYMSSY